MVQVVEWTKVQNSRLKSGVSVSRMTLLFMRVFMLGMLAATASKIPTVVGFGLWALEQPAVQELKRLQSVIGPMLGVLGVM